jgi:enoyl-CoA hydratase
VSTDDSRTTEQTEEAVNEQWVRLVDEDEHGHVVSLVLDRPAARNAISVEMARQVGAATTELSARSSLRAVVLRSSRDDAFCVGADLKERRDATEADLLAARATNRACYGGVLGLPVPVVAAVTGYALGGGCELAMACDMIVASETAQFGQPEINLGVIPGAGGTQRMTLAVGKALAMEMVLNGRFLTAGEALRYGLANRVFPVEVYLDEAIKLAAEIAACAPVALRLAKEAVNAVYEVPLQSGLDHERRLFYMLFSTEDQKEGMDAFVTKRKPQWRGQ